jgi:putative hydrolase of the HAD superfamily
MTTSMGRAFADFCVKHGVDGERFKAVIQEAYGGGTDSVMARLERGEISLDEFEVWIAGHLSEGLETPLDPKGIRNRMNEGLQPDERMIDAVQRARAHGIRTALISNSWGPMPEAVKRQRFPELFDAVVISGDVGMRKPDPEIYLHTARAIGVPPHQCVFVDDLSQNVEGARAVGMEGIVHRSAEFTIPKLEELLGVTLSEPERSAR